jgi:dephospho-CoA kinase
MLASATYHSAIATMSSYLTWTLREIVLPLPLGIIISAVTERLTRRSRPYARLRNIAIKLSVALISVSFFSYNVLFLVGVILGTVLQPVGLTGGIATGKSTVSSLLQQQSSTDKDDEEDEEFVIIDVDGIAHDILLPNKLGSDSVYDLLVAEFGKGILLAEEKGTSSSPNIDRRKLGDIVFRDVQKRRKLNSITHPKIIKIMLKRILLEGLNLKSLFGKATKRSKRRVVCVDIPLLFEGGLPMRLLFGTIIVVTCKPDLQLERLHKRNPDLTLEQCRQRIASQIPVEEKAAKAHVVIRNDEDLKSLKCQVQLTKIDVAEKVSGKRHRGVELSWLVLGVMAIHWLKHYTILLDVGLLQMLISRL